MDLSERIEGMAGDRWNVSEKWSIAAAAFYGALVGPPLQVVQDAIADDSRGMVLAQHPEYLLLGAMGGAGVFMLIAHVRNRIVLKKEGRAEPGRA
jgi:hypothetical protein